MGAQEDPFFGGSDKLYYSEEAQTMVQDLQKWHIVSEKVDAYQLGLAIGIRHQAPVPITKGINFGNLYSLRHELLVKALMLHLHPELEPKARKDRMDEYAEGGIRLLHSHVAANRGIADWAAFMDGQLAVTQPGSPSTPTACSTTPP